MLCIVVIAYSHMNGVYFIIIGDIVVVFAMYMTSILLLYNTQLYHYIV
jgi:hypothetical protein